MFPAYPGSWTVIKKRVVFCRLLKYIMKINSFSLFFSAVCLFFCSSAINVQSTIDPSDGFYRDSFGWQLIGDEFLC